LRSGVGDAPRQQGLDGEIEQLGTASGERVRQEMELPTATAPLLRFL
jgi:hypothetical protein